MRIYISGSITNNRNFRYDFDRAAELLKEKFDGCDIVNPAWLHKVYENGTHAEYMKICLQLLKMSDTIYMLPGWEVSKGARKEYNFAIRHSITVFFSDKERFIDE